MKRILAFILIWMTFIGPTYAALSASTVWDVRTGGSDTNGGGYVSGGTDWSMQNNAQYSVTDGVTAGTTTITSATANFGTDVVGNIMYVQGGTGSVAANWYQIISRTNSTTIVVDRSTGLTAGTGVTLHIGGSLASWGILGTVMSVTGMKAYIKSGTYTLSTSTAGSGGPVSLGNLGLWIEGYGTTHGDLGTAPVLDAGAITGINMFTETATTLQCYEINLELNGKNGTNNQGFIITTVGLRYLCTARNFSQATTLLGFSLGTKSASKCLAYACGTGFSGTGYMISACRASHCTLNGATGTTLAADSCIFDDNTSNGLYLTGNPLLTRNCVFSGNGASGIRYDANNTILLNCVATSNSLYHYNGSSTTKATLVNCASLSGTRFNTTPTFDYNSITLSVDPFVNGGAGDFRPNISSTGGNLLRGIVKVFGQTDNRDVGAVQHGDYVLPTVGQVLTGIGFGDSGTQYTGTLSASGGVIVNPVGQH